MNVPSAWMELFVTHIETESRLLKIWAQVDRAQVLFVERLILQITHHFNKGEGAVKPSSLEVGQLCCAKYVDSDGKSAYYRARIINLDRVSEGKVAVQFVDYGNSELMQISDIKSLRSMQTPLTSLRDQATEFYLAGVISKLSTWDEASLESIKQHLRYEEVQGVLMAEAGEKKLLRIYFQESDYSEYLTSKGIGVPIQLPSQQQFLLQSASLRIPSPLQVCNFNIPPPRLMQPQGPLTMMHSNLQPAMSESRVHRSHLLPTYGEKVFTTPILEINTEHMVYVSFVEDGPWSFAVQLQAMEETLAQLMVEINEYPPAPLTHPLMPGSVCLGRFSEDQTLCRAVVMSTMTDKCMLYYVDFGNSEARPYSEIYELPSKYINPKVMALRFTLSGLKDVPESDEIKALFKEIVTEKLLVLKVLTPDGPPVKQYCELIHNGQNVLQILLEKTRPLAYKPLPLSLEAIDTAVVSYIVNPSHFYIQLSRHFSALNAVMMAVEAHCTNSAQPLTLQSLKVGLPCCALYAEDEKWYRAQIISILPGAVNVKYVDYGNSDTVSLSSLRKIERKLVSVLHMQAVKCCLNGFEDMKSDLLAAKFEELTGEETLKFVILGKVEDCLIVDLYSTSSGSEIDIGNVLLETKATMEQQTGQPVQHEKRYEAPAPVIAETDEWQEASHFKENSEELGSTFNRHYQSRAVEKERFNRGSRFLHNNEISRSIKGVSWRNPVGKPRYNDDENKDSWRSQKEDRSWRSRDDGNGNWRDDHDKGKRGKERFGEGKWGGHDETEKEQKPWREDSGEQREYKKKPWARDEDRGGYRGGGNRRNTEDGEGYYNRRNDDRRRNAEDGEVFQSRRGDGRRQNPNDGEGVFSGQRDDRRKRFNNEDSRRGRDTDRRRKNMNDGGFDNSRGGRKPWNNRDNNYNQFNQKNKQFGESAPLEQAEEEWNCTTNTTTTCATIKPLSISIGDIKTVEIVFSTNPQDFYIQVSDSSELFTLMNEIATVYESAGAISAESLKSGTVCIARYAEDETWYRAVVESVSGDSALVFFCDYGNKENVPLTYIKEINCEHINVPAQGIPCSLFAAKPQDLTWSASETDCFIGATEGKTLEATFVSQNNGRFDVILKDTESNSDINLQFGATLEQLEAKVTKGSMFDKLSAAAQSQQIIELSQRFACQSFSPDTVEQVSVTWFINPEQFYCQLKSSQAAMFDMMTSIQNTYCSKPPTSRPFQIGLPVIAKFRADNVLYRAEVKDIADPVSVIVQFIDYGNCDSVMNSCIWDMETRFMNLPKQAVPCTLKGVKSANENWTQSDTMKYFMVEEFQCTFHGFVEEKYEVTLVHNGMNVATGLIEAGLARKEILETTDDILLDAVTVDLSLLHGQTLKVHITFVESASKFFVHLNAALAQKIQTMVDHHAENPENLQPMDAEKISVGDLCLASPDSIQWYRAKIVDCTQTTGVFVTFIDFGDGDEVPVNKVMVSPLQLQIQPPQATECALHGLNVALTPETEDKFKSCAEDKDVIMKVEAVETERLLVSLYDMEGRKLEVLKDTVAEPLIEGICQLPVLSKRMTVWVSHVNNANSLWLQRVNDSKILSELLDKLHNIYEEEGKGVEITPTVGSLCAAKSESFGTWYRARIISVDSKEGTCDVLFIDYGNTETIPIATNVKSLDKSLFSPHALAIHISLPLTTSQDLTSQLQEMTADKEFIAVFCERNDERWLADLFEGNTSLSSKLVELGHATRIPRMEVENQLMESKTELASELPPSLEVLVSHFDSPGQFWLQLTSNFDAVMKFQENIQIIAESLPATHTPKVGMRCITQFSEDNLWYRAVVLDVNSSYITVRYTDYGSTSQLEVTADEIKELPEELGSIPDFAFPCCINASPIDGSYWNAEAVARCEELLNQKATITINVVGEEEIKIVDVFVDGVSVVGVLLKENLAVSRKAPVVECSPSAVPEADILASNAEHADFQQSGKTVEPPVSDIVTKVDDSVEIYEQELEFDVENEAYNELGEQSISCLNAKLAVVSHAESVEEFWLQYQEQREQMLQLEFRLLEAEFFPPLNDTTEEQLCAAIFADDNHWYRAKILGKVHQGIQVEFIDYGNISVCNDLRKLPADLASLPPMAQHCSLVLPETITEWPPGAKEKFLDIVSDGCKLFEVNIIEQGDPVTVSLTYDGKKIQTEICQDVLEVSASANIYKTEQSVEQENSTSCYMIDNEEYQEEDTPDSFENKVEVPEHKETIFIDDVQKIDETSVVNDAQKIKELDSNDKYENDAPDKVDETSVVDDAQKVKELNNDECGNDTSDKVDDTDVTTTVHFLSDAQEMESQKEALYDDQISDLYETSSPIDKDFNEKPETEASCLNAVKENGDSPAAAENLIAENDTEVEKHSILVAEGKQYIDSNGGIVPIKDSEMDASSGDNLVNDEKPKSIRVLPEKESDSHEVNALNTLENPNRGPSVEKTQHDSGIFSTFKSSECKIEHTEELVRKLNVEMMVVDKGVKISQMDRTISSVASKEPISMLPQSDNSCPSYLPEKLPRSQNENGATKSEPCTPLLSRAERLSVMDEKQERSLSSPRLSHNERIVPGCISRGESLDSVDETVCVTLSHDKENIVPDTTEIVVNYLEQNE